MRYYIGEQQSSKIRWRAHPAKKMSEVFTSKVAMRLGGVMAEGRLRARRIEVVESGSPTEKKER